MLRMSPQLGIEDVEGVATQSAIKEKSHSNPPGPKNDWNAVFSFDGVLKSTFGRKPEKREPFDGP